MIKRLFVILVSLVVFFVPNVAGFGLWFVGSGMPTVLRSLVAILAWVLSFGLSTLLFWRITQAAFHTEG